ncbi:family 16 glycosylhydrolase [Aureibaculum sp. 2210JD6-5]|uniref:glycerophosphodiester phosphodiesterase family protein n=1 Tax=Aureibaculum sp. 2210JD6-5 TaxID=3103957 RepID=UPI002AAD5844|nr:family 16 glycosylhydrolase [Aureibaculum sp. 2210JD6-5]MDY7394709.1 family 16 glycosylhydrolase [Aureibaculum sp. 2210JD6-5]
MSNISYLKNLSLILVLTGLIACDNNVKDNINFADNVVVAHRGAFKAKELPENSIAALKYAIELGCTGSEFDVHMTADSIPVVYHDPHYNDLTIKESTYEELSKFKLSNGEILPTLKDYILAGMENNTTTGLVLEIKPSKDIEHNLKMTEKILALVKELKAEPYIHSYISFGYGILQKIVELDPNAKTQYLNGSKSPQELKNDGISGLDYHMNVFKKNPHWIEEAKELGLTLNAWTVNAQEDLDWLLANEFDYITTNEPELLFERIKESPTKDGYSLVWSDEFNYKGKLDSTKWGYAYGFIANQEEQYYTDSLKNARVEDGNLIIETHKEAITNKDYNNPELLKKSWMKYAAERKTAKYTSARLTTKDLASWQYGRIEVRAKLPKGVGMWPAIWMLGNNRSEVSWPECGEIDIMEHVGFNKDSIFGTIHTEAYNHTKGTEKSKSIFIDKPYDEFHVFALDWTPEKIDFILDGVVYNQIENEHKTTAEWPFDQKFYLILNVAVGGMLGGQKGIDDSVFPQQMVVDYVRVYQQKN